jgi:Resolvase, N terminal domain
MRIRRCRLVAARDRNRKKPGRCPMNERTKITASHLGRQAIVYLRQSSAAQVEHNRESTERQYALATKARELGWPEDRIIVVDEDLGLSGSGSVARSGFARLTAEVALARVGLVLGLEVSRLARNNADWHRLIDLAITGLSSLLWAAPPLLFASVLLPSLLEPLVASPLASKSRFSRSIQTPGCASRRLHAGCRLGSIRTSPKLIPEVGCRVGENCANHFRRSLSVSAVSGCVPV